MELAVKTILGAVSLVFLVAVGQPVQASKLADLTGQSFQVADASDTLVAEGDVAISEGEAADIAQSTQPGAKVIKVKLLPSGIYAVTLKEGGNVTRVMVDATSGTIL
jgi:uncharacterized membrane protein YkoI